MRVTTEWREVEDDMVAAVLAGEPVIIPTDTVYGLAARALDVAAISQLFALKRRPADLSIAALVADVDQASEFADITEVEPLVKEWWPGALTVVVPKLEPVAGAAALPLGAPDGTVGLRVPAHDAVRRLAKVVGPIAATSANLSGAPTLVNIDEITEQFGGAVAMVIDEGPLTGLASTVVKVVDGQVIVLREGAISGEALQAVLDAG